MRQILKINKMSNMQKRLRQNQINKENKIRSINNNNKKKIHQMSIFSKL
jgi:hypothetical protein